MTDQHPAPTGDPGMRYPSAPQPAPDPGRSLGIAGFVLSLLIPVSAIGLILSIIALVQSRKAGRKNKLALAGVIIGATVTVLVIAFIVFGFVSLFQVCSELGNGVHQRNGITYTCNL
ncbi:hypothetical protein GCM10027403_20240 [Arthrobacter tecti]